MEQAALIAKATELKSLLHTLNKASEQIHKLEWYEKDQNQKLIQATLTNMETIQLQSLTKYSVVSGVKRAYEEYRSQLWSKIQKLSNMITQSIEGSTDEDEEEGSSASSVFGTSHGRSLVMDRFAKSVTGQFITEYRHA